MRRVSDGSGALAPWETGWRVEGWNPLLWVSYAQEGQVSACRWVTLWRWPSQTALCYREMCVSLRMKPMGYAWQILSCSLLFRFCSHNNGANSPFTERE